MGRPKQMKNILKILKDKVSILKATISLSSKPTTSFHIAILRATTLHHPIDPPPLDAVLALALHHLPSAGALLHALLHRLHGTHSAYVALKCLLTLHYIITHGTSELRERITAYSSGPLFNLSNFIDKSERDTWELSNWVQWYAYVLDFRVSLLRIKRENRVFSLLVNMVEKICGAPETLHYQKLSLVYEIMKLVGEDYRMIMREISTKINIFENKRIIGDLSDDMLEILLGDLKRVENCREKVLLMFLNKKKYDGVWELIEEVRRLVEEVNQERESMRLLRFQGTELTRVGNNRVDESKSLAVVLPGPRVRRWLDVGWNR